MDAADVDALRRLVDVWDDARPRPAVPRSRWRAALKDRVDDPEAQAAARKGFAAAAPLVTFLASRGLCYDPPSPLSEMSDPPPGAAVDGLPLPWTHYEFLPGPADRLTLCERAGREVGRAVEVALVHGMTTDDRRVHGLTDWPQRRTLAAGPADPVAKLVDRAVGDLTTDGYWGPYALAHGPAREGDLRDAAAGLRADHPEMDGVVRTPALTGRSLLLVQLTHDVVRLVTLLPPVLLTCGPRRPGWRAACVVVPQLRADWSGRAGVAHVTA